METQEQIRQIFAIRDASLKGAGNFDYGANVIPVIKHYLGLPAPADKQSFLTAVEAMLRSENNEQREYAVTLCLGFVAFRDAV